MPNMICVPCIKHKHTINFRTGGNALGGTIFSISNLNMIATDTLLIGEKDCMKKIQGQKTKISVQNIFEPNITEAFMSFIIFFLQLVMWTVRICNYLLLPILFFFHPHQALQLALVLFWRNNSYLQS